MRYFRKTTAGLLALLLLGLAAYGMEDTVARQDAAKAEEALPTALVATTVRATAPPTATPTPTPPPEPITPTARIYDIPLARSLQEYAFQRCEEKGLDYEMVLALISKESGYNAAAVSGTGDYGLMQINEVNHAWLQEELGITDFMDAEQSIDAGTEILGRLAQRYDDPHQLLMAYNMGEKWAKELWAEGITSSEYSRDIMARRAEILEGGTK